jgi:tRNA threonylcarbamoyladenosine biosynthesis protein TsaB
MAHGLAVCPVSCLEALAWPYLGVSGLFCAMLDARRKQVYAQVFRMDQGDLKEIIPAQAADPDQIMDLIADRKEPQCWFAGPGATVYRDLIAERFDGTAHFVPGVQNRIRAAVVAEMANQMLAVGRGRDAAGVLPRYIRKSDAERKQKQPGK